MKRSFDDWACLIVCIICFVNIISYAVAKNYSASVAFTVALLGWTRVVNNNTEQRKKIDEEKKQ